MKGFGIIEPLKQVGWVEKEIPEIGPYEALLEPVALIPCTSDVDTAAENPRVAVGRILGHEGVGRIVKVGECVKDFKPGDVVAVPAVTPEWRNLQVQDCNHQHAGGYLGSRYLSSKWDGMFAEYFKVPDVDMNVALIPEGVSIEQAALAGDMVTTGFHGVELADVKYGDEVVVIGIGPVGLMSVVGCVLRGASHIYCVGHREVTKKLALEFGATAVVDYTEGPIVDQIMALTGGRQIDKAIICGGEPTVFNDALALVKYTGVVSNLAGHGRTELLLPIYTNESGFGFCAHKTVTGGLCPGGRRRLERLLDMIQAGRFHPEKLITHRYNGFEKIEDAFNLMKSKSPEVIKPIIYCDK
ncbi:MAG: zinc-binding dehydrogenase [Spirochaetales bacterium]|nr:zinc-binding dehydrogenase [Candidatus Physcosoma equi]